MYGKQPKKMLIMNILDILKRYTDEDHRLSQKEIMDILEREYDMKVERKAVKRNLLNLIDYGYHVEYSESVRINKKGEEEIVYTDWYLERDFSDAELRLLIDSLLFSRHIPYSQCKMLIEKLENLSNRYFKSRVKHIQTLPDNELPNRQLFYTIEILDQIQEISLHRLSLHFHVIFPFQNIHNFFLTQAVILICIFLQNIENIHDQHLFRLFSVHSFSFMLL